MHAYLDVFLFLTHDQVAHSSSSDDNSSPIISTPPPCSTDPYCVNIVLQPKEGCDARYVCGDRRLGPVELPKEGRLAAIFRNGFERFQSTLPYIYLKRYWNKAANKWFYPPNDGFALKAVKVVLHKGVQVDRFGSPYGRFLTPAGTEFGKRAIPYENLSEDRRAVNAPPLNYYVYEVLEPFEVLAGPIAPHFGAPGCGLQYYTNLTSVGGVDRNVSRLVEGKFLKDITFL
jgi:hypothetical protein